MGAVVILIAAPFSVFLCESFVKSFPLFAFVFRFLELSFPFLSSVVGLGLTAGF